MPLRRKFHSNPFARFASLLSALLFAGALTSASQTAVTTYHNDNYRTGWNSTETVLTPANVGSSSFGLLFKVKLDDQVDAVPPEESSLFDIVGRDEESRLDAVPPQDGESYLETVLVPVIEGDKHGVRRQKFAGAQRKKVLQLEDGEPALEKRQVAIERRGRGICHADVE